jgi:hypothetical protein
VSGITLTETTDNYNPMLVLLMDLASMEQRKGIIKPHKMGVIVDLSLQLKVFQTSR